MMLVPVRTTIAVNFKHSPYKAGLLIGLTLVLLVLVARLLAGGPRSAVAAPPAVLVAANAGLLPDETTASVRPPRAPMPDVPDRVVRDLFATDWSLFKRAFKFESTTMVNVDERATRTLGTFTLELTLTDPNDGGRRYAVINGNRVGVGDVIDGARVESISPGIVILADSENERIVLRMN